MARLFYPILFCVTVVAGAALWAQHDLPLDWLSGLGARQAQAQLPDQSPRASDSSAPTSRYVGQRPVTNSSQANTPGTAGAIQSAPGGFSRPSAPPSGAQLKIPGPAMQPPAGAGAVQDERQAGDAPIAIENAKVIARIGYDCIILLADVINDVEKEFAQQSPRYHPRDHEALKQLLIYQHVKQIIPIKALAREARKEIPEEKLPEVQKQLDTIFNRSMLPVLMKEAKVNSPEEFDAKLKAEGSSLQRLIETIGDQQVAQTYIADHVKVDEQVSPDELYSYYRAHYDEYKYEAQVRYEELVAKFSRRTKAEAIRTLADMGNQVRNGVPWAVVAKARSEGFTATEGGQVDWTTQGSLRFKMLDEALFSLPVGAMSIILEDERSAYIVRVVERKEAGAVSFEEAQAAIKKKIVEERTQIKRSEFIRNKLEELRPIIWTVFDDRDPAKGQAARREKTAARPLQGLPPR